MFTKLRNSSIGFLAVLFLMIAAASALLGSSFFPFFRWYLLLLVIGVGFFPLTRILLVTFQDGGWLFSRVIGMAIGGYAVWVLGLAGILQFTAHRSLIVTLIFIGALLSQSGYEVTFIDVVDTVVGMTNVRTRLNASIGDVIDAFFLTHGDFSFT